MDGADIGIVIEMVPSVQLFLAHQLASEEEDVPQVPAPVVTASEDGDMFEALDAEMANDRIRETLALQARTDRDAVVPLLAAGPQTLNRIQVEQVARWLQRRYVILRTAELERAGTGNRVGVAGDLFEALGLSDTTGPSVDLQVTTNVIGAMSVQFQTILFKLVQIERGEPEPD